MIDMGKREETSETHQVDPPEGTTHSSLGLRPLAALEVGEILFKKELLIYVGLENEPIDPGFCKYSMDGCIII